jgi:hypothetical protein
MFLLPCVKCDENHSSESCQKVPNFQPNVSTVEITKQQTTVDVRYSKIYNNYENNSIIIKNLFQIQKKTPKLYQVTLLIAPLKLD